MSPASTHAEHRALIVERIYQPDPESCVRAVLALLTPRPARTTDATAAPVLADSADRPIESRQ